MNITSKPGEINKRKSKDIVYKYVTNARINSIVSYYNIEIKEKFVRLKHSHDSMKVVQDIYARGMLLKFRPTNGEYIVQIY